MPVIDVVCVELYATESADVKLRQRMRPFSAT